MPNLSDIKDWYHKDTKLNYCQKITASQLPISRIFTCSFSWKGQHTFTDKVISQFILAKTIHTESDHSMRSSNNQLDQWQSIILTRNCIYFRMLSQSHLTLHISLCQIFLLFDTQQSTPCTPQSKSQFQFIEIFKSDLTSNSLT